MDNKCSNSSSTDNSTMVTTTTQVIFGVVTILLSLIITAGNGLIITAVYKYRELRCVTNFLIVNLSLADLLIGVVMLPLHAAIFLRDELQRSYVFCVLRYGTFLMSFGASCLILIVISGERLIAIRMALRYTQLVTMARVSGVVGCVWLYAFVVGFTPSVGLNAWTGREECDVFTFNTDAYIYFIVGNFFVLLGALIATYGDILRIVRQKLRATQAMQQSLERSDLPRMSGMMRQSHAIKTIGLVVGAYVVSLLPFVIVTLVSMSVMPNTPHWLGVLRTAMTLFMITNCAINPLIYHKRNKQFRRAFHKMLPFCQCHKRVEDICSNVTPYNHSTPQVQ